MRHRWELNKRNNSKQVIGEHEDENGKEEWHKLLEIVADYIFTNVISNKTVDRFAGKLQF